MRRWRVTQPVATPSAPAVDRAQWPRGHAPGLLAGALALAIAWFAFPVIAYVPFAGLAVNLALAWGAYTVLAIGIHLRPASHAWWVPAMAPWLAAPMLLRMHFITVGEALPAGVVGTWSLEAISLAAGVLVVLAYGHLLDGLATTRAALATSGFLAFGLDVVFVLLHMAMPQPTQAGAVAVFSLAVLAVTCAVAAQRLALRSNRRPLWRALAGGAALAATASQLLDGFVTYLAVNDPFRLLDATMTEQMPVSAFLLEYTGFGYPLTKWALALAIAYLLERGWGESAEPAAKRTATYLVLIVFGLGPGLYSTARLLS